MLRNTGQNIKGFLDGFCEAAARLPSPAVLLFCLDRAPKLDKNTFKKEREGCSIGDLHASAHINTPTMRAHLFLFFARTPPLLSRP